MAKIKELIKEVAELKKEIKRSSLFRKRIYTQKEAAEVAGISLSYIQKLTASGELPHSKPKGKLIFIRRRDLEKFLMKNYIRSSEDVEMMVANKLVNLKSRL